MNPLGAIILLVLIGTVVGGSRKTAALAMLAGMLFLPQGQQLSVAGFNLFADRILGYVLFFRVIGRGEFSFSKKNAADKTFLIFYAFTTLIYFLRSDKGVAYIIAKAVDAYCVYFSFRGLIRDLDELKAVLKSFLFILAPFTLIVLFESVSRKNLFGMLGGVSFGWIRAGRLRCFGSFRNPDLLGTVGALFLPLFVALALGKDTRKRAYVGILFCLLIVYTCNSGGPISAAAVGVLGWLCWRIRFRMQTVRRCLLGGIILAALMMKAPVWYLIARMSSLTGGDGWHRSYLLDVSFHHFYEWFLMGINISKTVDWFPYVLSTTGGADITNEFLSLGLTAGCGSIFLFILFLKQIFSALGKAMAAIRARNETGSEDELMLWALGVTLTAHVVNLFGITYFDQSYVLWFMQLAVMSTLSQHVIENSSETVAQYSNAIEGRLGSRVQYEPINN